MANPVPQVDLAAFQPDIAANLGAMIRSAACFGVPIHVIEPCGFPFSVKALRRAAMDYAATIHHHDGWEAYLAARGPGRLILLTTKTERSLFSLPLLPGDTFLLGRESAGVPEAVAARADHAVAIPMPGGGRSLNVSVSAGIALAEATRQWAARA